jgi:CO/xanthine dehydrogenase FAD-binding subunit
MSIGKFDYFAPKTLDEAVALLKKYGPRARVMAGGTDLMVKMRLRAIAPEVIVCIREIEGLDTITVDPRKGLTIGAMALLSDVAGHPDIIAHYPAVAAAAGDTANVQVRNMGTVVGNLCNASPSADNAPALLIMGATVRIVGPDGERTIPLGDFFRGPGITALTPGEIVTSVSVPEPPPNTGVVYRSFSGRGKLDCSTVGVGALMTMRGDTCENARIAIGACAPVPMFAPAAEKILTGQTIDEDLLRKASRKASEETRPIDDVRASATYRLRVVEVLTCRVLLEACAIARK